MAKLTGGLIIILGALTAFAPLSIDMYLPSLPTLAQVFAAPPAAVQLTLSAFLAGLAIGQAFYGPLSDRVGRKSPLYAGLVLYILASVGCAYAPGVPALIGLRFAQALGGCAGIVIARAVVRDCVDGQEAARVFSTLMLVMGVAPILAPLLGGFALLWLGWRAIFSILALFGLGCLLAVALRVPETRPPATRTTGGIGTVLATYGRLLADRQFLGHGLTTGFGFAGMFVYITGTPHLFIDVYGVPAQAYGWLFGTNAIGLIGASQFNRLLLRRHSLHRILAWGISINLLAALALLAVAVVGAGGLPALLVPLFLTIASLGLVAPNATAAALASHAIHAGSASALLGAAPYIAGAAAGAVLAALHDDSAAAMTGVIAACSAIAFLAHRLLAAR